MAKKKAVTGRTKKGGPSEQVLVRCQPEFLKAVDKWRARQLDKPSRPQAIIRLTAHAIKVLGTAP